MYAVRRWSVRNAGVLEKLYAGFERFLVGGHPLWNVIGYTRLERPVALVEKLLKGFLFDCQMCGQCALSSTGMSCPMNCPKGLRNGPCGGVRQDGRCEIKANMRCVWVEAWNGASRMRDRQAITSVQVAVDFRLAGKSSWLRVARDGVVGRNTALECGP